MPRKIIAHLYMTLDGRGEFPTYPGSEVQVREPDEMFNEMWVRQYDHVDTVVFGRRSFEGHVKVHALAARKPTDAPFWFDYSRFLERSTKIALSRTLTQTSWVNSRITSGALSEIIGGLRGAPGKDIIVDGGPALVQELLREGLADELKVLVMPVVLGRGPEYWGAMSDQVTMVMLKASPLPTGELYLHFRCVPRAAPP